VRDARLDQQEGDHQRGRDKQQDNRLIVEHQLAGGGKEFTLAPSGFHEPSAPTSGPMRRLSTRSPSARSRCRAHRCKALLRSSQSRIWIESKCVRSQERVDKRQTAREAPAKGMGARLMPDPMPTPTPAQPGCLPPDERDSGRGTQKVGARETFSIGIQ
jgi:hypothetical protein